MTTQEKDITTSLMFLSQHMSEMLMQSIERDYQAQIRDTEEYKRIKKQQGLVAARLAAKKAVHKILFGEEVSNAKEIKDTFERLHYLMERQTNMATGNTDNKLMQNNMKELGITVCDMTDSLIYDTNFFIRIILLIYSMRKTMTDLQIESALKTLAKNGSDVYGLMEQFNMKTLSAS